MLQNQMKRNVIYCLFGKTKYWEAQLNYMVNLQPATIFLSQCGTAWILNNRCFYQGPINGP